MLQLWYGVIKMLDGGWGWGGGGGGGDREFPPAQRPVTWSFGDFFDLCLSNGWINDREVGEMRRHRAHYDFIVMLRFSCRYFIKWYTYGRIDWRGISLCLCGWNSFNFMSNRTCSPTCDRCMMNDMPHFYGLWRHCPYGVGFMYMYETTMYS